MIFFLQQDYRSKNNMTMIYIYIYIKLMRGLQNHDKNLINLRKILTRPRNDNHVLTSAVLIIFIFMFPHQNRCSPTVKYFLQEMSSLNSYMQICIPFRKQIVILWFGLVHWYILKYIMYQTKPEFNNLLPKGIQYSLTSLSI